MTEGLEGAVWRLQGLESWPGWRGGASLFLCILGFCRDFRADFVVGLLCTSSCKLHRARRRRLLLGLSATVLPLLPPAQPSCLAPVSAAAARA